MRMAEIHHEEHRARDRLEKIKQARDDAANAGESQSYLARFVPLIKHYEDKIEYWHIRGYRRALEFFEEEVARATKMQEQGE